ncbi:MAG: hypothetical protein WBV45_04685 [Lutimonas sp.]
MKKIVAMGILFCYTLCFISCTTNDVKEISGTMLFNDFGDHEFHINAENIEATVTIAGPNNGEVRVFENVKLDRTSNYHAKIGVETIGNMRSELRNNLVLMFQADSGGHSPEINSPGDPGYIKIDWKGVN